MELDRGKSIRCWDCHHYGELIRTLLKKIARADYNALPALDLALLTGANDADAITRVTVSTTSCARSPCSN